MSLKVQDSDRSWKELEPGYYWFQIEPGDRFVIGLLHRDLNGAFWTFFGNDEEFREVNFENQEALIGPRVTQYVARGAT